MEIHEIILVTENEKGVEINSIVNFTEYMLSIGCVDCGTLLETVLHAKDLVETKADRSAWTEIYRAANRSVSARYCLDMEQLCHFLAGGYNDKRYEYYLDTERCGAESLKLLEDLGINRDGTYREGKEHEQEYAVEISEVLKRIQKVTASSLGEAIEKVMEMYDLEQIVLNADDFLEVTFKQEKEEKR